MRQKKEIKKDLEETKKRIIENERELQQIVVEPANDLSKKLSDDPEQFIEAKTIIRGILENVQNFNNYTYIDSETEAAGGTGNLALNNSLKGL